MYEFIEYREEFRDRILGGLVTPEALDEYTNYRGIKRLLYLLNFYRNYFYLLIDSRSQSPVGCVVIRYRFCYRSPKRYWWVYGLVIRNEYRRQGLGRVIMEHVANFVASRGGREVLLYVEKDNQVVLGFYNKLGYEVQENHGPHRQYDHKLFMRKQI